MHPSVPDAPGVPKRSLTAEDKSESCVTSGPSLGSRRRWKLNAVAMVPEDQTRSPNHLMAGSANAHDKCARSQLNPRGIHSGADVEATSFSGHQEVPQRHRVCDISKDLVVRCTNTALAARPRQNRICKLGVVQRSTVASEIVHVFPSDHRTRVRSSLRFALRAIAREPISIISRLLRHRFPSCPGRREISVRSSPSARGQTSHCSAYPPQTVRDYCRFAKQPGVGRPRRGR